MNELSNQLEQFLNSAKDMESQLSEERRKTQKIAKDYLQTRQTLEGAVQQLKEAVQSRDARIKTLEQNYSHSKLKEEHLETLVNTLRNRDEKLIKTIEELRRNERDLRIQTDQKLSQTEKVSEELAHYKAAWQQVLERDNEAKAAIAERETWRKRILETDEKVEQLKKTNQNLTEQLERSESHSKQYQSELQSVLIRLQSAEGKFNQLQKEYALISQNRKNTEEEIDRYQKQMEERLKWEAATAREKMKAEFEREAALEREKFRELSRKSVQIEIEKCINTERARMKQLSDDFDKMYLENQKLRQIAADLEHSLHQTQENRHKNELEKNELELKMKNESRIVKEKITSLQFETESLRGELKKLTTTHEEYVKEASQTKEMLENKIEEINTENLKMIADKNQLSLQIDELRRSHSKQMLLEKFRFEQDVETLQSKIDELERKDCKIAKVSEDLENGAYIYLAEPVSMSAH